MSDDIERTEAPRRQLGDFILLEEIGRGGMGTVYRARQVSMERYVALKVLPSFAGLDSESVARFQREAEAAGRLSHPGIVPIYAVGSADGIYYYAMELVEGPSLCQLLEGLLGTDPQDLRHTLAEETAMAAIYPNLQETPIPAFLAGSAYPASCAALIMEVAGALTAAHQGMVIHRDLKPSNILVHPAGRPVLVDFGLARDELAFSMTQTGDAVGTPSYMAPEQAAGVRKVDARVDVYGLGATLYEMLTLRPPFVGNHTAEVMQAILEEDPIPPRRLNSRVPKALETIVMTCLAKEPDRRYSTTSELSADLRSFLAGGVIQARRPGLFEVLGRRFQRHRRSAYVALMAVMSALLVGLLVGLVILDSSRQAGRRELQNAKALLAEGRSRESHAAYVRALVLLKDSEMVAKQRLESFREVFPTMYAKGRFAELQEFLDTLPPAELDQPEYHAFQLRIRGVGHLSISTPGNLGSRIYVRGVLNGRFEPGWRRLSIDGALTLGRHMVRIETPGMASVVRAIQVERDQTIVLSPVIAPSDSVPDGMCLVDPGSHLAFAVDREEFTIGQYSEFLRGIEDPELAAEMVPLGWTKQVRAHLPVTGLSHRQARVAAQILERHLLSREEYHQAATAGLRELVYPWGHQFDIRMVVGDPRYAAAPLAGNSRPGGASPGGIMHLVGNVGEPLSAGGGQPVLAAGGSYLSEPRDLTLRSFIRCRSVDEQRPGVGLRLARFLPAVADPGLDTAADRILGERLGELSRSQQPYIANQWRVQASGRVELRQNLTLVAGVRSLVFPTLRGFVPAGAIEVFDGSGRRLPWQPVLQAAGTAASELRGYRVDLTGAGEGTVELRVKRALEPLTGLHGHGDSYCLRLPLTSRTSRAVDCIELPVGCRVETAWPVPDSEFLRDGAPVLVWHRGVDGCRPRHTNEVILRFRRDGAMSDRLAARRPVVEFVSLVFDALARRDATNLAPLLAEDCRFLPGGLKRSELLASPQSWDTYAGARVLDVTSVGRILSVELQVSWRPASLLRSQGFAERWPLRMMLRRTAGGFEVVRLMPSTRFDDGELRDGVYRHRRLEVRVEPPTGVRMHCSSDGMVELQIVLHTADDSRCSLAVLGCMGEAMESAASLRMRLTASLLNREHGERCTESQVDGILETGQAQLVENSEQWLFEAVAGAGWRCERWTFLALGRRRFLVRSIARGATRDAAQEAFRAASSWFETVRATLRID